MTKTTTLYEILGDCQSRKLDCSNVMQEILIRDGVVNLVNGLIYTVDELWWRSKLATGRWSEHRSSGLIVEFTVKVIDNARV